MAFKLNFCFSVPSEKLGCKRFVFSFRAEQLCVVMTLGLLSSLLNLIPWTEV